MVPTVAFPPTTLFTRHWAGCVELKVWVCFGKSSALPGVTMGAARMVKAWALAPVPAGAVTAIGPVVAPEGTVAVSCVGEAAVTVAGAPLKVTWFLIGVALNPRQKMVTLVVPAGPRVGVKAEIPMEAFGSGNTPLIIWRMFPMGS